MKIITRENKRRHFYVNLTSNYDTHILNLLYSLAEKDKIDLITYFLTHIPVDEAKDFFEDV